MSATHLTPTTLYPGATKHREKHGLVVLGDALETEADTITSKNIGRPATKTVTTKEYGTSTTHTTVMALKDMSFTGSGGNKKLYIIRKKDTEKKSLVLIHSIMLQVLFTKNGVDPVNCTVSLTDDASLPGNLLSEFSTTLSTKATSSAIGGITTFQPEALLTQDDAVYLTYEFDTSQVEADPLMLNGKVAIEWSFIDLSE